MIKRLDKEILAKYHQGRLIVRKYHQGRLYYAIDLWLKSAAQQAIMDAFGVDGTAVIAATNEYLNGIAASDMAKATALAGFINEVDPLYSYMLYNRTTYEICECIKSVSTGSYNQYIDTGYYPKTQHTRYEVGFKKVANRGDWNPIINNEGESGAAFGLMCTLGSAYGGNNKGRCWVSRNPLASTDRLFDCVPGGTYDIKLDKHSLIVNGDEQIIDSTADYTANYTAVINGRHTSATAFNTERSDGEWNYLRIYEDDEPQRLYYPCYRKSDNKPGLFDVLNLQFRPSDSAYDFGKGADGWTPPTP